MLQLLYINAMVGNDPQCIVKQKCDSIERDKCDVVHKYLAHAEWMSGMIDEPYYMDFN